MRPLLAVEFVVFLISKYILEEDGLLDVRDMGAPFFVRPQDEWGVALLVIMSQKGPTQTRLPGLRRSSNQEDMFGIQSFDSFLIFWSLLERLLTMRNFSSTLPWEKINLKNSRVYFKQHKHIYSNLSTIKLVN